MDPETQTFIDTLRTMSLSDKEKDTLRTSLLSKIRSQDTRAVVSAWSWALYLPRIEIALLALVIFGSYGSTLSLAAEGALPGEVLYPIKTAVTEPIMRLVVAQTPLDEAAFETKLLEKRLAEAEDLDGKIDTDPALKKEVQDTVRAQSVKAKSRVARVEPPNPAKAAPAAISMKAARSFEAATSSVRSFAVSSHEEDSDDDEKGKPKRALKGVYEKHKRILERLELESEREGD